MAWARQRSFIGLATAVVAVCIATPVSAEQAAKGRGKAPRSKLTVTYDVVSVSAKGPLTQEKVTRTLEKSERRFLPCYQPKNQDAARDIPQKAALRLLVQSKGKVVSATVEHPMDERHASHRKCLQRRAMDIRFDAAKSGYTTVRFDLLRTTPGLLTAISRRPPGQPQGFSISGSLGGPGSNQPVILGSSGSNQPVILGSMPRDVIQRVVRSKTRAVRACYEAELAKQPQLKGRVMIRFIISPTGAVTNAVAKNSTLNSPTAEACIVRHFMKLRFPSTSGGITIVSYPYNFTTAP